MKIMSIKEFDQRNSSLESDQGTQQHMYDFRKQDNNSRLAQGMFASRTNQSQIFPTHHQRAASLMDRYAKKSRNLDSTESILSMARQSQVSQAVRSKITDMAITNSVLEPELVKSVITRKYMKNASLMYLNEGNKTTSITHKNLLASVKNPIS